MRNTYVIIDDLVFNGGECCRLLEEKPAAPHITITARYDMARGRDVYKYWYRDVDLGTSFDQITIGALDAILQGIRGRGKWIEWAWGDGDKYVDFTPEEERTVKWLGLWVY